MGRNVSLASSVNLPFSFPYSVWRVAILAVLLGATEPLCACDVHRIQNRKTEHGVQQSGATTGIIRMDSNEEDAAERDGKQFKNSKMLIATLIAGRPALPRAPVPGTATHSAQIPEGGPPCQRPPGRWSLSLQGAYLILAKMLERNYRRTNSVNLNYSREIQACFKTVSQREIFSSYLGVPVSPPQLHDRFCSRDR